MDFRDTDEARMTTETIDTPAPAGTARRDTRAKQSMPMEGLAAAVTALLDEIQASLLDRARRFRDEHTSHAATWAEFTALMEGRPGFVVAPWCGEAECETAIKAETQATIRNIPFGSESPAGQPCGVRRSPQLCPVHRAPRPARFPVRTAPASFAARRRR